MIWFWVIFFLILVTLLALDLGVFHKEDHTIGLREAVGWTFVWVGISLLFNGFLWLAYANHWFDAGLAADGTVLKTGSEAALEWFTGYLIEKSLSVDNIFVIALIFGFFRVPSEYQHRVLFWGILGALVFRGVMVGVGTLLVKEFDWIFYVFGAILVWAALKMVFMDEEDEADPDKSLILRVAKKIIPFTYEMDGHNFRMTVDGKRVFSRLFLVLLVIEATDVVFAFDSIPAIFAITTDPFIVLTSNMFAILGLRSLYFVLAGMMDRFRYLKYSLALILLFVGVKLTLHAHVHIPTVLSLGIILAILVAGVLISLAKSREPVAEAARERQDPPAGHDDAA